MKKEEIIAKRGEAGYAKMLAQANAWGKAHPEERAASRVAFGAERNRKGGKYYEKKLKDQRSGIPGDKNTVRKKHAREYKTYKKIIAPLSQIHHEWIPGSAEYTGVALVEKYQHMHGFVDVIEILEGKITLLSEEEVKNGKRKSGTS